MIETPTKPISTFVYALKKSLSEYLVWAVIERPDWILEKKTRLYKNLLKESFIKHFLFTSHEKFSSSTAVSSTAPEETPESSEQALAMDADQLPEEPSRIDETRTVLQPKANKRAREPSSIDDEAAKRSKTEPPQNPEPVETIEIEDDPEPELVEDEVVEVILFI